jgi:glutamate synthase (NADPH/NADH) large chain
VHTHASVTRRQRTFGYTEEELRVLLAPMARAGAEPIGRWAPTRPSPCSRPGPRLLFDYFTQLFAQVTNPPLDAIREELVTSLATTIGPELNALDATPAHCRQVVLPFPGHRQRRAGEDRARQPRRRPARLRDGRPCAGSTASPAGERRCERARRDLREVSAAIADGARFVVLSDRDSDAQWAPIPSLLLTSPVHHHLIRTKTRTQVGLLVEAGDVREVHHVALLIGYGAAAVNPVPRDGDRRGPRRARASSPACEPEQAVRNLVKALGKGVLKVMSKMGISTVASYRGAQVFEAIGLSHDLVERYFTGTTSRSAASGSTSRRGGRPPAPRRVPAGGVLPAHRRLETGGEYQWRRDGRAAPVRPETVFRLQHATRTRRYDVYKQYTARSTSSPSG